MPKHRRPIEDDGSGGDETTQLMYNDQDDDEMDTNQQPGQAADLQMAKKLVRYAIACEFSRTTIRRDGIKERVLGNQGRSFRRIFNLAQEQLKTAWGMELRELPVREKVTLQERRQAMKANSRSQVKNSSASYILTSTLPDAYRSAAILNPPRNSTTDEEATYIAFCTMVVSLIYLSGGELSEAKLKRHLARLNALQNIATEKSDTTLKKMERQGYVIKRTERPPLGQDGELTVLWHVGPRAKEEIALDGVIGMVRAVYGELSRELEEQLMASLGIKKQRSGRIDEEEEEEDEANENNTRAAADGSGSE